MMMRAWMCAVVALAVASAASAQVDFSGLDVPQYPAPAPVQKGGLNPVQGMPVSQMPVTQAPQEALFHPAPEAAQPEDAPGATWSTRWGYRGHQGYRWYPGYARHHEWANPGWYSWNHGRSYGSWYGSGYTYNNWYGTDPRWYGLHPAYRPYGWRDRQYPYAWSPTSVTCNW